MLEFPGLFVNHQAENAGIFWDFIHASLLHDGNEPTFCLTDIQHCERQDKQIRLGEKINMQEYA